MVSYDGGAKDKAKGERGRQAAHITAQDQVIDHSHDAAHGVSNLGLGLAPKGKVEALAIAQQASG